jgi:hypothetical protein
MISTLTIQAALTAKLTASKLFEKVMTHSDSDLGAALAHLRDNPSSIAVIIPGADTFTHKFEDEDSTPVRAEWKCGFDILFSGRQLDKRETGDAKTLELKDAALNLLFWDDLDIEGLIVLPGTCEPLAIEFENGKGREAWKLSADLRQLINPA